MTNSALLPTILSCHVWWPTVLQLISRSLTMKLVTWQAKFQLVLPYIYRCNRAECAIRTFKDHFLVILFGADPLLPPYLWDLLLPQAELTLNLLRQVALNPWMSAWEFLQGPFDFNKTLLGPIGCHLLIHTKPNTSCSRDFCAKKRILHWTSAGFILVLQASQE